MEEVKKSFDEFAKIIDGRLYINKEKYEARVLFEEGEYKGKQESKLEIAKNLLKTSLSIDEIANSTGLTKEEILSLK